MFDEDYIICHFSLPLCNIDLQAEFPIMNEIKPVVSNPPYIFLALQQKCPTLEQLKNPIFH